ncbi:hypothetical protein AXG93_1406s1160 [Marchantia polymorpha subsp. ruderalis]|uniref:Uncharacterized protein n=1 Tax=Marchantia polymorpha subsp. ruderalis TaxID=1480154 RepID=A0A176W0B8_MARPO|nr:hypothetical protein AXG93_1406s1160 [Marchantia polymorpha subsp. ruderalis]
MPSSRCTDARIKDRGYATRETAKERLITELAIACRVRTQWIVEVEPHGDLSTAGPGRLSTSARDHCRPRREDAWQRRARLALDWRRHARDSDLYEPRDSWQRWGGNASSARFACGLSRLDKAFGGVEFRLSRTERRGLGVEAMADRAGIGCAGELPQHLGAWHATCRLLSEIGLEVRAPPYAAFATS